MSNTTSCQGFLRYLTESGNTTWSKYYNPVGVCERFQIAAIDSRDIIWVGTVFQTSEDTTDVALRQIEITGEELTYSMQGVPENGVFDENPRYLFALEVIPNQFMSDISFAYRNPKTQKINT